MWRQLADHECNDMQVFTFRGNSLSVRCLFIAVSCLNTGSTLTLRLHCLASSELWMCVCLVSPSTDLGHGQLQNDALEDKRGIQRR